MPSVVVPAHNEETYIAACIEGLLSDAIADLEVVIVPNACSDRTTEIARSFGDPVTVLETATPGKANALNLGETKVSSFPRAFIDGDIVLRPGALDSVFNSLRGTVHIASPAPQFDTAGCDLGVRLFYKSLKANAYFASGAPNGSGAFAVTEQGRARWGLFPDIIADDGFVELHFSEHESATATGPPAIVRAPRTFTALLDIKTRGRLGRFELASKFPDLASKRRRASTPKTYANMLCRPTLWPTLPVYTYVRLKERRRAERIAAMQGYTGWLRDDTSRTVSDTPKKAENPG